MCLLHGEARLRCGPSGRTTSNFEIQDTSTSGDTTWFRIRATGTNDGPLWGRPATGRPIDITVMDVMRVADGRMVEHWGVAARLAVLKQVGAMGQGGR